MLSMIEKKLRLNKLTVVQNKIKIKTEILIIKIIY